MGKLHDPMVMFEKLPHGYASDKVLESLALKVRRAQTVFIVPETILCYDVYESISGYQSNKMDNSKQVFERRMDTSNGEAKQVGVDKLLTMSKRYKILVSSFNPSF
jgi:hypothetical protein